MNTDRTDRLWKALRDPTRRRILDLLRERPRSSGEVAAEFAEVTRFATRKHLRVLEEAQLVTVRREGRVRWNHLNAVPLQALYERWIRPFEAEWAARLLQLERVAERPPADGPNGGNPMPQSTSLPREIQSVQIEQEIRYAVPAEKVFNAMIGDISAWWGRPYIQDGERARGVEIEPELGGRFLEKWSDDDGAIWATVTRFDRGRTLHLTGPMAMPGATHGVMRFELEPAGDGCVLKFSHHAMGHIPDEVANGYQAGWEDLLGTRLKNWVEHAKRMGLGSEA